MKVLVVGCGRFGIELAVRLENRGDEVVVLDSSPEAFANLPQEFHGRLVEGDVLNQDILLRAGIKEADAVAVVTNSDVLNLVVGRIARQVFHIPNVVARNYEVYTRELYEVFNLQVISAATWGTQRIIELLNHTDARLVYSAGNGEVTFYEVAVPEAWEGKSLKGIFGCAGCQLAAITRGGAAFLPEEDIQLMHGDVINVGVTVEGADILRQKLAEARKEA